MNKILILYGSTEGQAAKIARYIGRVISEKGYMVDVLDGRTLPRNFSLEPYSAAIIGASMHISGYQKYIATFIQRHRTELERIPAAFFSVSLSEAYSQPEQKVHLQLLMTELMQKTGWHPQTIVSFAGALAYSKYGFFKRLVMKRIAQQVGASTDSSQDYEYTDWQAVTHFAEAFISTIDSLQTESVSGL